MTKLNDTQLVILAGAAQRKDGLLDFGADPISGAQQKSLSKLTALGLLIEVQIKPKQPSWRTEPDGNRFGLQITAAGLHAIGIETSDANSEPTQPVKSAPEKTGSSAATAARTGSKINNVVDLLKRDAGASLNEIIAATDWLPHSARAALTGLRRRGHQVERFTGAAKGSSYRIVSSPVAAASGLGDQQ